jgi:hypothetical protein
VLRQRESNGRAIGVVVAVVSRLTRNRVQIDQTKNYKVLTFYTKQAKYEASMRCAQDPLHQSNDLDDILRSYVSVDTNAIKRPDRHYSY